METKHAHPPIPTAVPVSAVAHSRPRSVATRLTGVDAETLLPGVEHVGNTFVSQIGYQAKGYAIIPIM